MQESNWKILVVDRDKDYIKALQDLVAKLTHNWNKPVQIVPAETPEIAYEMLQQEKELMVAIFDLQKGNREEIMKLCSYIRESLKRNFRIILTGEASIEEENQTLSEHDIDHYVTRDEVTPQKTFLLIRSCIRISQDMATMSAFGDQLQRFTNAFQSLTSIKDLLTLVRQGFDFLQIKFNAKIHFIHDIEEDPENEEDKEFVALIKKVHETVLTLFTLQPASRFGRPDSDYVLTFVVHLETTGGTIRGGVVVSFPYATVYQTTLNSFRDDICLFLENWIQAYNTLSLQQKVEQENKMREQMYMERIRSIANMVTGVAHEVNTPLGVANTSASMIRSISKQLFDKTPPPEDELEELRDDLNDCLDLLTKNIERAHDLIKSFKQLSSGQLSDAKATVNIQEVIDDCVRSMRPETKKKKITFNTEVSEGLNPNWDGYPGHLSQVVINFIQNTIRYGYPEEMNGKVDIRLSGCWFKNTEAFQIVYQDYGQGIPEKVLPQIFDPFVTTGRNKGGTGLGLAIVNNIVCNLLNGDISCESIEKEGAKFTVVIPRR